MKRLKPYVLIDGTGRVVPSSLVKRYKKPMNGNFIEVTNPSDIPCCIPDTYVAFFGEIVVEPDIPDLFSPQEMADRVAQLQDNNNTSFSYMTTQMSGGVPTEGRVTLMYYDSTGLIVTEIALLPIGFSAQDLRDYVELWAESNIRPLVPTLYVGVQDDRIKFGARDRAAYLGVGIPFPVAVTFSGSWLDLAFLSTTIIESSFNDFQISLGTFGSNSDPVSQIWVPYFPPFTFNVTFPVPMVSADLNFTFNTTAPITGTTNPLGLPQIFTNRSIGTSINWFQEEVI